MADETPLHSTLEDATGAGVALRQIQTGDSTAGKNGALAFAAKDSAGNATLLCLNPDGTLPVDTGAAGSKVKVRGEDPGSETPVDVATLVLTASKTHSEIEITVSCYQETHFQLIQDDNATETELDNYLVGPGNYTFQCKADNMEVLSGGAGTQELILRGTNLKKTSTMRASIRCIEQA